MHDQPPQILTIREITGRIEAVLSWLPDATLRKEAQEAPLNIASHLLDPSDNRILLFDGPRAIPCQGPEGRLCVLPLVIPESPGRYRLQIEPVVEGRFWASQRNYTPLVLDAERFADGSLHLDCTTSGRRYVLDKSPTTFAIDGPLYGVGDSERCVEIPWSTSRYRGESQVLDVGHTNAEPRHLAARNLLRIPRLIGLDIAAVPQPGILGIAGDALAPPFLPGTFDLIFAISVIEHIGHDNSIYSDRNQPVREFGDLEAAASLASLLRPGGRLLITVPFGGYEDHGWFVQYDQRRIASLLEFTGCDLTLAEYYAYAADGWYGPVDPGTLGNTSYRTGQGAGAVACLEFTAQ